MAAMSTFYTYLYIDPTRSHPRRPEGEPIYVGKGTKRRAWVHLKRNDKHPLTNRLKSLKKKGVEPIIVFLAKDIDEELAFMVEEEAIELYGRKDLKTGTLLNLNGGGEGGRCAIIGPSTRAKLSQSSLAMHADPIKRQNYLDGRKKTFTDTWRQNTRQAQINRFQDPEKKARLLASTSGSTQWRERQKNAFSIPCTVDGITWYASRNDLAAALGWGKDGVGHPSFRYKEERRGTKPVYPCTVDGINIYRSRTDLIKALGNGKNGRGSPNFRYLKDYNGPFVARNPRGT